MPNFSQRALNMKPSPIVEMAQKAKAMKKNGQDVFDFTLGIPNFLPETHIYEAAKKFLEHDPGTYFPPRGTEELLFAFQQAMKADGFNYDTDQLCSSIGAKNALSNLFIALLNEGDEVVFPAPYWSSYPESIEIAGGVCINPICDSSQNYKLSAEQLENSITEKTKIFLFNNPSNPTGMVYSQEEVKDLGNVLEKHPNIWIISDDIYDKLIYDGEKFHHLLHTNPNLKDRMIIVQSISKKYGMPGWRVGMVAAPKELATLMSTMNSNMIMDVPGVCMAAATAAFSGDQTFLEEKRSSFQRRRDIVLEELAKIEKLICPRAQGAFFVFPDISAYIGKSYQGEILETDLQLCLKLLEETGVATVPGSAFGMGGCLRISYACPDDALKEGLEKMQGFFSKLV